MDRKTCPGFAPDELRKRYDISSIREDLWHAYTDERTHEIIRRFLRVNETGESEWLLNAGSGVYEIGISNWREVSLDLFAKPIAGRRYAVCANVEAIPFCDGTFGAVVCVGEVLAYCDPSNAIREFARVLKPDGTLICDFGSTRSFRHLLSLTFGKAATVHSDMYNGSFERTWIYDPHYIIDLLDRNGMTIRHVESTHIWSALARRLGCGPEVAVGIERALHRPSFASGWGETVTIVADRSISAS